MQLFSYAYNIQRAYSAIFWQKEKGERKIIHRMYAHTHILEDMWDLEDCTKFFFSFGLKTV